MEQQLWRDLQVKLNSFQREWVSDNEYKPDEWTVELSYDSVCQMCQLAEEYFEKVEALKRMDLQILQQDYKKEVMTSREAQQPSKKMALTISPQEADTPDACLAIIQLFRDLPDKIKFKPLRYCIEQRSEDENFVGFHLHLIIESNIAPSKVTDSLVKFLTGKRGHPKANSCTSICNANWETKYMSGIKTDKDPQRQEHKQAAARMDIKMREKYGFPLIFDFP